MAYIRKLKNKRFIAEVRKLGLYQSRTFDSKVQAMAWAVEAENNLSPNGLVREKTLSEAFIRYRDEVTPRKKSANNEYNRLNRLLNVPFAPMLLETIQQQHVDHWIQQRLKQVLASSINRDLNLISAVFEKAKRWRWIDNNPIRGLERPKNPPPRDRRISPQEIERILDALEFDGKTVNTPRHIIAVAFLLAIETAMRQGEIWKLKWDDVFLDKCYLRLHETKNGTKRDVPLSQEAVRLLNLLATFPKGKVFKTNQNSSGTIFRRALTLAGITGLTFHDTRHEALTRLAQKLEVLDLARMVGHRDPRSLMIYYNPTAEEIAARLN